MVTLKIILSGIIVLVPHSDKNAKRVLVLFPDGRHGTISCDGKTVIEPHLPMLIYDPGNLGSSSPPAPAGRYAVRDPEASAEFLFTDVRQTWTFLGQDIWLEKWDGGDSASFANNDLLAMDAAVRSECLKKGITGCATAARLVIDRGTVKATGGLYEAHRVKVQDHTKLTHKGLSFAGQIEWTTMVPDGKQVRFLARESGSNLNPSIALQLKPKDSEKTILARIENFNPTELFFADRTNAKPMDFLHHDELAYAVTKAKCDEKTIPLLLLGPGTAGVNEGRVGACIPPKPSAAMAWEDIR